ncbi:hypothetical protein MCACP_14950 [Neomoorella carbonis]
MEFYIITFSQHGFADFAHEGGFKSYAYGPKSFLVREEYDAGMPL